MDAFDMNVRTLKIDMKHAGTDLKWNENYPV